VRAIISSEPIPTFGAKSPVDLEGEQRLERVPLFSLSLQVHLLCSILWYAD
jgi:hypothetical protein